MEEGRIPDEAITASSSYEMKSVGPQNARYAKISRDQHGLKTLVAIIRGYS